MAAPSVASSSNMDLLTETMQLIALFAGDVRVTVCAAAIAVPAKPLSSVSTADVRKIFVSRGEGEEILEGNICFVLPLSWLVLKFYGAFCRGTLCYAVRTASSGKGALCLKDIIWCCLCVRFRKSLFFSAALLWGRSDGGV